MQIVLTQNCLLGKKGEVKNVKKGFFRNYLFPQKFAVIADKGNLDMAEILEKKRVIEKEKLVEQAKEVLDKLQGLKIDMKAKVSKGNKLYGSVKDQDVIDEITKASKVSLEKKNLENFKPIKTVGEHKLKIRINEEVATEVTLNVVKE